MITVTQPAVEKIKEVLQSNESQQPNLLRIQIDGYGWGGPQFRLTLDELKGENDKVIEANGLSVIYNKDIEENLQNMVLDYEETSFNRGFTIKGSSSSTC